MPIDLSNKPVLQGRGYAPVDPAAFDPSQLTDAKAQIEYLVNTGKLSVADANQALRPYGAKLDLQASNRGRGPGGRDYYQVTGNHSLLKEFVLPASLMVGAGVGLNVLANALAAGAGTAGYSAAAPNAVNAFTTPTLTGSGLVGASGSVPASIAASPGVGLAAAPAAAVPAAGASVGTGFGFGAGGTPVAASFPSTAASAGSTAANVAGNVASAAGGGLPFWAKAGIGFGADLFKTFMANRASGNANKELQKGIERSEGLYKDALGPYMNLGAQGADALGYLMGLPGAGPGVSSGPMSPATASAPASLSTIGRTRPTDAISSGSAVPRGAMVDPSGMGGGGSLSTLGQTAPQNAPAMTRSSFVRMQAPDGEIGEVPFDLVAQARAKGARELV